MEAEVEAPGLIQLRNGESAQSSVQSQRSEASQICVDPQVPKRSDVKVYKEFCDFYVRHNMLSALDSAECSRCRSGFDPAERILNSGGELYHMRCFSCAQCLQEIQEGVYYEFEGRKYCEHDFQMLFAPCCHQCGEFVVGRVIKAMNGSWHPNCFCCDGCQVVLADTGFVRSGSRHLCRPCHVRERAQAQGKFICQRCQMVIEGAPLVYRSDPYHPDHFSCSHCGKELTSEARELRSELFCLPCHDKLCVPICGACRRPIEGRIVNALGKHWHVEHFVCTKCEKPFLGHPHCERRGLAYCETHYNQLFGDVCFRCNRVIEGEVVSAINKAWCVRCFSCSTCNAKLTLKYPVHTAHSPVCLSKHLLTCVCVRSRDKFVELDLKPVCKHCYERVPDELKRRLSREKRRRNTCL
ncbi:hypothetical protein DNTS_003340 [Danionella cerebrum]|uniref:LIM domain-containing protein n=1 Tax=Danionella cerebrum TaxID=2873325 RepID=A0A553QP55_9TELE|nr:hypothetical protein DNTS_003340 [Danionella translucida]TRY91701.1 hypothetical protein DNTS_003340 [Danionella translucida]TRY91704.1 hypothetical protein DNTS_003340 [Danionella translucida]TRY91705.1 hypothetical protein DNTS_003340 [Danionella translucida]TRY91706.1 hypothetical protein DNTS_003340 [Danionella translucida]